MSRFVYEILHTFLYQFFNFAEAFVTKKFKYLLFQRLTFKSKAGG